MLSFKARNAMIGLASVSMAGCSDGVAPDAECRRAGDEATRVGASGGTLTLDGGAVVLTIPPGAVTIPCGIAVAIAPWTDFPVVAWSPARALFGTSYEVRAFDLSPQPEKVGLAIPATLSIGYDLASVPPGVSEAGLVLAQVTRVDCLPDMFGWGCSWDLGHRSVPTSRIDTEAHRLTASLSCLDVCGGRPDGTGDGTGQFLIMHPDCSRSGSDPADPHWHCESAVLATPWLR